MTLIPKGFADLFKASWVWQVLARLAQTDLVEPLTSQRDIRERGLRFAWAND